MSINQSPISRRTVIKGIAAGAAACLLGDLGAEDVEAATVTRKLPRVAPEAVGIDPAGVAAFLDAADAKLNGLHSIMMLCHGQVAAEGWWYPYAPQHPHMLFSLTKSFTSTAVGFAVAEGLLTVEDPVLSFFPDDAPATVSANLQAMRVKHLLTMSNGRKDTDERFSDNWVRSFLACPIEYEPGTHYYYDSMGSYMLSAIVQKKVGRPIREYLMPRLFKPLGIATPAWDKCPKGINTGGWGLNLKTEDIAKFGQLYLQRGKWNGKQLLPATWVDEATRKHTVKIEDPQPDWHQGYGYQFWRCRHNAFRGDGAAGQYCIVMPDQDAVIAITSGVRDMQAVLNVVWEHLLPAFGSSTPAARPALKQQLSKLEVPHPAGAISSATAKRVAGRTYRLELNGWNIDTLSLHPGVYRTRVTYRGENVERSIVCGAAGWDKGEAALWSDDPPMKVASRGVWTDDATFVATICYYEGPVIHTISCHFDGDDLTVQCNDNTGWGPKVNPPIKGHLVV
jgi:CubicO group peptidase (beta-lactamase class C family)